MSRNDVTFREGTAFSNIPTKRYQVAASATVILAGEPVYLATSEDAVAVKSATLYPLTSTPKSIGIAQCDSTNTSAVAGYIDVYDAIIPGQVYLCKAYDATAIATQALYNALVNERCAFNYTAPDYTIQTTSAGTTDGLVIVASDIAKFPGLVAFEYRASCLEKY